MSKKKTVGAAYIEDSYLVIGDVHGCYDELIKLIDTHAFELDIRGNRRHIVFVGDLVDKGPRGHRCLELAKLLGATVVLGNHEENHIRFAGHEARRKETGKKNPMKRPEEFKEQHRKICASPLNLIEYMQGFPHYVRLLGAGPQGCNVVVLHGGLLPGRTPKDMDPKKIVRVRNVHPDGRFANLDECTADPTLPFWTERYDGDEWVLFGHAPFLNPRVQNKTVALDTGVVYGNRLTAMKLPEMELVHVVAHKKYQEKNRWDDE